MNKFNLSVRELGPDNASAFRALRLHALKTEGELFGPTYENEVALSHDEWVARVTPTPDIRVFGLFDNDRNGMLAGFMRAGPWNKPDEDPSGQTALWGQAYVLPSYRNRRDEDGQKLSAPLYAARAAWTQTRYKAAVTFIREDNERSQAPHVKHGAELAFKRIIPWPNREPVSWNFYRVEFTQAAAATVQNAASTLAHIEHIHDGLADAGPLPEDRICSALPPGDTSAPPQYRCA
jgi:hypothetical protein